jgi:hypothetical protein
LTVLDGNVDVVVGATVVVVGATVVDSLAVELLLSSLPHPALITATTAAPDVTVLRLKAHADGARGPGDRARHLKPGDIHAVPSRLVVPRTNLTARGHRGGERLFAVGDGGVTTAAAMSRRSSAKLMCDLACVE